jgi:hypothetical protein
MQSSFEAVNLRVPYVHDLDGTALFLPFPERRGKWALTYLPANDRTILAWWGLNPWDVRPGVNAAIITEGKCTAEECWGRLKEYFPNLVRNIDNPLNPARKA